MSEARAARGFTLIELMISVAIMGIFCEFIVRLSHGLHRVRRIAIAHTDISRAAQTVAFALERDIRSANAVAGRFKELKTSDSSLILDAPRVGPGGSLLPGGGDRIAYFLETGAPARLIKQVWPAPGSRRAPARQILAENVLAVRFSGAEGAALVSWEADFGTRVERRLVHRRFSSAAGVRRAGF